VALEDRRLMSTFTVTNTADSGPGSLRDAIGLANLDAGASTVDFESAVFSTPQTITLTGQLELSNTSATETITGPAAGLTVSGGGSGRVFAIDANVNASISGLTITGGVVNGPGAGLANYGGTTTLLECNVSGNSAVNGGGVFTGPSGTTTLNYCTVNANFAYGSGVGAYGRGGGIYDLLGSTTLSNCTISGNTAGHGGGVYNYVGATTLTDCALSGNFATSGGGVAIKFGTSTLTNCRFSGDIVSGNGGGLYSYGGTSTLTECTFSGETASLNGGGVYNNNFGTVTLYNCLFNDDSASVKGGGLANSSGTTTLIGCTLSGNSAENGGGLYNFMGSAELADCTVSGNSAEIGAGVDTNNGTTTLFGCSVSGNSAAAQGGGVFNYSGTTNVTDCVVSGNSAANSGGLGNYHYGTTILTDSSVSGNVASSNGGGVVTNYSTTTLTNCTVSGNSAATGGGLYTDNNGATSLSNSTVSGNSAIGDGGGVFTNSGGTTTMADSTVSANSASRGGGAFNGSGALDLGNTIVAANSATTSGPDALGTFASQGNNLIGQTDASFGWVGSDLTGTSAAPLNPLLAPLGNYGGPTETMALLPGSPAIDTGNNALIPLGITTDQRGLARIVDVVVDIGAFESNLFTIAVTSGSEQATPILTAFPAPLVATVTANNPNEPVAGGRVTFTPPSSGASAILNGSPATINADSTVSVTATANGTYGTYTVSAGARGITNTAVFSLSNKAIPVITTTPSASAVTLSTMPVTLRDTAVISNGFNETGAITFTLYLGNTLLDTEIVPINGDGNYTTANGYTLPTTGTVTGTYQWNASYPGDDDNTPATENNSAAEQVTVSPANPAIVTTPSVTSVTLGTSPVTLNDTAVLSGGYYESGTLTFTLYLGSTLVDTESVTVSGNGSYTTPTGYALPTTGTVTGTYQWNSSFSGDTNNNLASENNAAAEQVTVSKASPSIVTTPSITSVTLSTSSVTLNDTAVLSGGYYESGTLTFTLYQGSTLVDTETMSVSGNGSYTTPTGYALPTTGTVTGTYQWNSSFSGDTNNNLASENNAAAEQVTVSKASPSIVTTPSITSVTLSTSSVTLNDTAVLSGGYYESGTLTFTLYQGSTLVDTETMSVSGNGSYTTPTGYALPTTGTVTGTYQWNSSFSGDTNNNLASENNAAAEQVTVSKASPSIVTTPSVTSVTLGTSSVTLNDTAVLSGGYYESGTLTFTLYQGSTLVDTESVSVSGNGTYATPTGYALPTTGTVTGTYQWNSSFSGDTNNNSASETNDTAEQVTVSKASPSIVTTPSMTSVTLGTSSVTLNDTAVLSGGYYESGTLTFTLYLGSTLVDTESVSVSGNGSYATPTGYALPTTGTVTGTYQWNSSFSGATNNNSASENNAAAEQVTVSKANPSIVTTPSVTSVTLGTSSVTLNDTAVLSGGYYESGTLTFTLYLGSTLVDTESVSVSGNGTYTTPTGYTLPTTGTVTGTYQWNSSFSGDTNNNSASENNAAAEQVTVSKANPSIVTTPSATSVTLSTSSVTLNDTAVFSAGYHETGTLTFTLYQGSTLVDTETMSVSGNGSYTTPTGYTLPTSGTVTGTYQWNSSFSGDTNNNSASENNNAAERVLVSPAGPSIVTTPNPSTVTLSSSSVSISGTKYLDLTGNGFTSDDTPQSGVTIDLYQQVGSSVTLVGTTVTATDGTFSFAVSPGTFRVSESVPSGYIQTGGGPNGSAGNAYYTVVATSGHSYSGYNFDDYLVPTCTPTSVSYKVTTTANCSTTVSNLAGNTHQGDTVTVTFTVPSGMNDTLTLVSYIAPGATFSDSTAYKQVIYQQATGTFTPGTHSLTVRVPNSYYQIDFVCGTAIAQLEPGGYGPDGANILYHAENRFLSADNGGTTAPNPMPPPSAGPTTPSPTVTSNTGTSSSTLTDSAVLAGGYHETGTITFTLIAPNGTTVDTETVAVNGNGTYVTPTGYALSGAAATGTYQWNVSFTATDANNLNASESGVIGERVTVSGSVSPSITTIPGGPVTIGCGTNLTDSAILWGGNNPGGTITFYLFAPGVTPNGSNSNNVYSDTVTVSGDGTYATSMGNHSGGYAPMGPGTYQWVVVYSGDAQNGGALSPAGTEPETVAPYPVVAGEFATIGFWHNSNGQAVINSFNGSSTAKALGNWLASNFPNLFGGSNPYISAKLSQYCVTSFAGLTNAQVAAVYQGLWTPNGVTKNTYAQAFAVALGIYADTSTLGGNSTAQGFGFSVTAVGGGPATFNVGSNGAAFGVANNASVSVLNVLHALDSNFSRSSGNFYSNNQTLTTDANNVVNGINTTGDITNTLSLSAADGISAYTPAQIRAAYGISDLSWDGTGQTIAIVDAFDDPNIYQALDAFDLQFGLTDSAPSLAAQYGPATSFLTVVNQGGQTAPLPGTDPSGPGTNNWEVEAALDVEWVHAIAPGAQIVLVEANSQSLSDLMAAVGTAAGQPGVSVVTMSWGFPEGQAVFAADEASYDNVFNAPGVTFLASTGDYGAADPEYPAFSPNVVAVGGTSLNLGADNSYNGETGWGGYSDSAGMSIGSGGGFSLYEPEPSYQQQVQATGSRSTPDVSLVADPVTGAWIADPYNLGTDNPFEVVGGTSLSAPIWAALVSLANEGRAAAGVATLNTSSPTEIQDALYSLPQSDYNMITSGSNGYTANAGYNLVTGLGTPVANLLVSDLVAYQGPGTTYAGPTVGALQDATLDATWSDGGDTQNVFSVLNAFTVSNIGITHGQGTGTVGTPLSGAQPQDVVARQRADTPLTTFGTNLVVETASLSQPPGVLALGSATFSTFGQTSQTSAAVMIVSVSAGSRTHAVAGLPAKAAVSSSVNSGNGPGLKATPSEVLDGLTASRHHARHISDAVLDELAADSALWPVFDGYRTMKVPRFSRNRVIRDPESGDPLPQRDRPQTPSEYAAGVAFLGMAAGLLARGTGATGTRKRRSGGPFSR
jgi:hypothetical protein